MNRREFLESAACYGPALMANATTPPARDSLPGEWPCYRRNGAQDAHSPCRGRMTNPRVCWKQFVGSHDLWMELGGTGAGTSVRAAGARPTTEATLVGDPRWGLGPPVGEIGGRLLPFEHSSLLTHANVLRDEPGLQRIEFESGFAKPTTNGDWAHDCVGRCFAWRGGKWVEAWKSEPIDMLFSPYPLVGDFDGDGQPEIAVLPWHELVVLDARTGRVKDRCRFTEGRSYGYFGAFDIDGDGRSEFVVQADFAKHVDVLGYRAGKLSLLWRREIEVDVSNPQKVFRVHPNSVIDVDGDGRCEVITNVLDDDGSKRWHITVHDGLTGEVKARLVDQVFQGVADVDGDGVAELLTVGCNGAAVPGLGALRIVSLKRGRQATLWEEERAGWVLWEPMPPLNVNSAATLGRQDVMGRTIQGRHHVVLRREVPGKAGSVEVRLAAWSGGRLRTVAAARGAGLAAIGLDAAGHLLLRSAADSGPDVRSSPGRLTSLGVSQSTIPPSGVAVSRDALNRPIVIAVGALGREALVGFRPPSGKSGAAPLWRVAGRGQGDQWPYARQGPVVADLLGRGSRAHLWATAGSGGSARLVATTLEGRRLWHHDFEGIPGTPPVWNTGGILFWQTGHFTDNRAMDVVVTVRHSMMHSEETLLLSGRDGAPLWRRSRQVSNRGVGGTPFAIADFDGDGLDDIASLHPSLVYILDGATGKDILARDATWDAVPAKPVYWGIPVAVAAGRPGRASLYFGTTRRSMTGLVRSDGTLAWSDALDRGPTCLPAFGDFSGNGRREAVGIGFDDGIRCYDVETGAITWRMPWTGTEAPLETASADLDGDGRDEVLVTRGSALYCIGSRGSGAAVRGELRWRLELPGALGPPAIADVDGSGRASIVVACADGWVYCIGE